MSDPGNQPLSAGRPFLNAETIRVLVRVVLFAAVGWLTLAVTPAILRALVGETAPVVLVATMMTFAAGVVANALLARMYEDGRVSAIGLGWSPRARRELLTGIGLGLAGAALIVALALTLRLAAFLPAGNSGPQFSQWIFITVLLFLGAFGEELLFHGYAFQLLFRSVGPFAAILPVAVLFGVMHMGNDNTGALAILNTVGWGVLLGYAYLRTNALWLPIGIHFGWNAAMPAIGVNLSGFTIGVSGYELRWTTSALWSGGDYGFEGGLFTTLLLIPLFYVVRLATPDRGE